MKSRLATFVLTSIVVAFPLLPEAAGGPVSEDVPVVGGTAAMAKSLGIDPVPDRGRFISEIARLAHLAPDIRKPPKRRNTPPAPSGRAVDAPPSSAGSELVPVPLTVAVWSKAVFRRPVAADQLVATIVADARASHLCHGLAALDDETLQFLVDHPAMLTRLYERAAAAFAASGASLRIRGARVVVPGGAAAADVWAAAVGVSPGNPEAFVRALFEQDEGRLAYLYDAIGELDAPRTAFALGLWMTNPAARLRRFKALVALNRSAIPQWEPAKLPFTRPLYDVASILGRVQVERDGSLSSPSRRSEWAWIFASLDLPSASPTIRPAADDGPIDAAGLAQLMVSADTRERGARLDQLAFGQRVFPRATGTPSPPAVLLAVRAFPRFRMLLLTLERSGVRTPAVYESAVRRAQQLTSLDEQRLFVALGQFQSALALVARMTGVRTLDPAAAEALITSLLNVPLNDGRYAGAMGKWLERELAPTLASRSQPETASPGNSRLQPPLDLEEAVLQAVAGAPPVAGNASGAIPWEGNVYRVDIAASEQRRLRRVRDKQGGETLDRAVARGKDEELATVLMAWTYAVAIADADSPVLLTGNAMRRHDFGVGAVERGLRQRAPWALPRQEIAVGVPWHVSGSLLGLEVALSGLALRRVAGDRAIDAPTLSSNERESFAATVALLNPYDLRDGDRDAMAAAIERGRARVSAIAERHAAIEELADEIRMDGWRRRALNWTAAREPDRVGSFFSMTELLLLGRASIGDFGAWGMSGLATSGCMCTRLTPPDHWRSLSGRPQLGLMASTVADLNLRVAVVLGELQLPAAAAKAVLSAAVQDFIDEARPTDFNDWLSLVRAGQAVPRERIEDYVAIATAEGPFVPEDR